jgi:hypothetical protein
MMMASPLKLGVIAVAVAFAEDPVEEQEWGTST